MPFELLGSIARLLIFCPITAARLGWKVDVRVPHVYVNASGEEMARSIWWRDGLAQNADEDERSAEGQRVILSSAGRNSFEAMFYVLQPKVAAWRHVNARAGDGEAGRRYARSPAAK